MWILALAPFLLQAFCIFADELIFHVKRGLPRWERIGHPLDTLTVIACFSFILFVPFSALALKIYIGLAVFSTIFVTKDEFVHNEVCPASEQWLHAVLFSLHPIQLASAGFIWPMISGADVFPWVTTWLGGHLGALREFLVFQLCTMGLFLVWQIVYWNFIYKEENVDEHQ